MKTPIVIVGSGLAGFAVAREFRKLDRETPMTLITREEGYFYSKPMLSTAFTNAKAADQLISTTAAAIAEQLGLHLLPATEVQSINPGQHLLTTTQGEVPYAQLVLALGADPIRPALAGNAAHQVLSVNDLNDYAEFRVRMQDHSRVAILGAGLIGCEFANDLLSANHSVHVIDMAPLPLGRLIPQAAGKAMQAGLAAAGVKWHLGTTVESVNTSADGLTLALANGTTIQADIVLSAIGLRPRIALAQACGIAVNRGIVVNRYLETSAPNVYALGDCAEVEGLVLPYVMPIMQAARALAPTLAGTKTELSYPAMPVVVKTPAMPTVVSPPAANAVGDWKITELDSGIDARFEDQSGNLLGFALMGQAVSQKAALTKLLPPVLA
jgi:rubredoxin---NAD+ reductase